MNTKQLQKKSRIIRKGILEMVYKAGGGHLAPALSIVELMICLYYSYLNIFPEKPLNPARDRFILSKGHAGLILYYILADKGFFHKKELSMFVKNKGLLGVHPEIKQEWGIEITSGSLGHGLPIGCGIALSAKKLKKKFRTIVLMGDGECQEGSVWEACLFASQHCLDNLTVIVDYNKLQAIQPIKKVLDISPFKNKWKSFNWAVEEIDGHNIPEILKTLTRLPFKKNSPSVILAHTVKGKGISYMENIPLWHYRRPDKNEFEKAMEELQKT